MFHFSRLNQISYLFRPVFILINIPFRSIIAVTDFIRFGEMYFAFESSSLSLYPRDLEKLIEFGADPLIIIHLIRSCNPTQSASLNSLQPYSTFRYAFRFASKVYEITKKNISLPSLLFVQSSISKVILFPPFTGCRDLIIWNVEVCS